jgi:phosphate transport system permease protein
VPTIFTLAEDALNNVPRAYQEASLALGATRLQTVIQIVVPASLSGIVAAIPSVVLGFFGIAVLGQALRAVSQVPWLGWVPGFPYSERLNVLTAGCLLALIAVPTIFTLAEDALNNVPRAFTEASFALGASRLQTIVRIIVPASLSGIVSAILLGFGRVLGETMVVLLCAGNRIAIPDFTAGLAVVTQPVHTMTGIIAQEMGEVVRGSIHYRALFVVGLVLFFLALLINYAAQGIVRRYRISIG